MLSELRAIRREIRRLKFEAWNTDLRDRMIGLEERLANLIDIELEKDKICLDNDSV